jgi:hypothetical protein
MPGVVSQSRAVVASAAVLVSLAFAGSASAGGPLLGLTDTVSNVTTGLGQTVETVGGTVTDVTGAQQASPSGSDQAAAPGQEPAPAADTNAAPQPAAPAPTAVTAVTAVTRKVVAETVPALAATTNQLASAASNAAEPVTGAALGNMRAVTGSAVAATGAAVTQVTGRALATVVAVTEPVLSTTGAAVTQVTGRALATVATVTEPLLPATGALLRQVDDTISTTTTGLVGTVNQVLAPSHSQGSNGPTPPPPAGSSGEGSGGLPGAVPPGDAADTPAPARRKRKAGVPASQVAGVIAAPPQALDSTPIIHRGSPPRVGARDGGIAVPSLAPPMRSAAPSTGSSFAGGASGFAFVAFAVIAGLFVLAAPGLGRRLKLWPALVRPLAFVSPPERPG